jgi:hypothetical protein
MSLDPLVEAACAAHWNHLATRPWDAIPEDWKAPYRECMRAALEAIGPSKPILEIPLPQLHGDIPHADR